MILFSWYTLTYSQQKSRQLCLSYCRQAIQIVISDNKTNVLQIFSLKEFQWTILLCAWSLINGFDDYCHPIIVLAVCIFIINYLSELHVHGNFFRAKNNKKITHANISPFIVYVLKHYFFCRKLKPKTRVMP